jgi:hypothetical protein
MGLSLHWNEKQQYITRGLCTSTENGDGLSLSSLQIPGTGPEAMGGKFCNNFGQSTGSASG